MRVALLHFAAWPEVERGTERIMHDLARDLLALGHAPRIVTSHPGRPEGAVEDGLPVLRVPRPPEWLPRRKRIQPHLSHLPFSYAALRRGDDAVAHAFHPTDALAALRWGRATGRPAMLSWMGLPRREELSGPRWRLGIYARAAREADAVVALSHAARDAVWRWLGVEARVIHPGVDLARFTPGGARAERPTLACLADPDDPRKRIPLLLEAFARARRDRPDLRLLLVRPRDAAPARELAATAGVELVSPGPDGVADVFRRAWASVLPSRDEAFGLVVVESLACGTPVAAAREGGPAEILDRPGIGALWEGEEPERAARALLEALALAGDEGTTSRCSERAADFTTLAGARRYAELYAELRAG